MLIQIAPWTFVYIVSGTNRFENVCTACYKVLQSLINFLSHQLIVELHVCKHTKFLSRMAFTTDWENSSTSKKSCQLYGDTTVPFPVRASVLSTCAMFMYCLHVRCVDKMVPFQCPDFSNHHWCPRGRIRGANVTGHAVWWSDRTGQACEDWKKMKKMG